MMTTKVLYSMAKYFFIIFFSLGVFNSNAQTICNEADNFQYVIITSNALKNAQTDYSLTTLRDYRIAKGLSSVIVTTEEIYSQYSGRDNAEKIRNFIKDAHKIWKTKFVLLGGDTNIIPARMMRARNINVAADMYYGCLDGDFDKNNNNIWGEVDDELDFEFDVFVGRASAENAVEMSNFVYKTITYENSPANASYHTKMIQYAQEANGIGNTVNWQNAYIALNKELSVEYFRLTDSQADITLNPRFGFINFGFYVGASHGLVPTIGNINRTEARAFANTDQFFFMLSIACLAGQFTSDCVAEHLCTSTRTGAAFAGMFNSHDAYAPYVVAYLHRVRDAHLGAGISRLGMLRAEAAKTYSFASYLDATAEGDKRRYQAYIYNLFGDPAAEWKLNKAKANDLSLDFELETDGHYTDKSDNKFQPAFINGASVLKTNFNTSVVKLDGVDDFIEVPHSDWNPMGAQSEMSFAAWICVEEMVENAGIVTKGVDKNPFAITLTHEAKIKVEMNRNNPSRASGNAVLISKTTLVSKRWYHIAAIINNQNSSLNLYVDGVLDTTVTLPMRYLLGYTNDPLYLGKDPLSGKCFSGMIDDVTVFSRDLSLNEILNIKGDARTYEEITYAHNHYAFNANSDPNVFVAYQNDNKLFIRYNGFGAETVNVTVVGVAGHVLVRNKLTFDGFSLHDIDISRLENGVFILTIFNNNLTRTIKFVR